MRVYLAAPYATRDVLRGLASELTEIGFTVTSSWLDETHDIKPGTEGAATDLDDAQVSEHARQDMRDIDGSDLLVLWTAKACGAEGGGGRHIETGYALAKGKPIVVIGEPENVFHRLGQPRVAIVSGWHSAVVELSRRLVLTERNIDRAIGVES